MKVYNLHFAFLIVLYRVICLQSRPGDCPQQQQIADRLLPISSFIAKIGAKKIALAKSKYLMVN